MEAALIARFCADAACAALAVDRFAWDERPRRGGLPAVVLTMVAPGIEYTHDGPDGLDFAWVQADVWAETSEAVSALVVAIRAVFERPSETVLGIKFGMGFLEARHSVPPEDLDGGPKLFRQIIEFRFHWEAI